MFTGLVEAIGRVVASKQETATAPLRLQIQVILDDFGAPTQVGDSLAVSGCCLTIVAIKDNLFIFEVTTETLQRTILPQLAVGDLVNIERSLMLNQRLGGHVVTGHIDGIGTVQSSQQRGSAYYLAIKAPEAVCPLLAAQGSVTVAGVSLTIVGVAHNVFEVALIPHTRQVTTLGRLQPGDQVNLEADLMARYAARLMTYQALPETVKPC